MSCYEPFRCHTPKRLRPSNAKIGLFWRLWRHLAYFFGVIYCRQHVYSFSAVLKCLEPFPANRWREKYQKCPKLAVFPAASGPLVAKKVFGLGQVRSRLGGCPYQILSQSGKAFGNGTMARETVLKKTLKKKQWPVGILVRIQKMTPWAHGRRLVHAIPCKKELKNDM